MEVVIPPDVEECRRLCREKIADAGFRIVLAETPRRRLPMQLPRAVWRSLAARDPKYLQETLRYLFGPVYARRLDGKFARARASRGGASY